MKKSLILGLSTVALGMASFSASADMHTSGNKWYAGVGGSWIASNFQNKYSLQTTGGGDDPTTSKKIGLEDKDAFGANFLVGYNFDFMNWGTFLELSYGLNSSSSKSRDPINHGDGSDDSIVVNKLGHLHTYALGVGVSKDITSTMGAYFKLSALMSRFDITNKIEKWDGDVGTNGSASYKRWAWGWSPTVGLAKDMGSGFTIKTDYSYQIYSTVKKGMDVIDTDTSNTYNKIKPRYHVVNVTLTKAF